MSNAKKVRVTLVKSAIGYNHKQRAILESLGLRRLQSSRVHNCTPQIQGMINKVRHLVRVEEVVE